MGVQASGECNYSTKRTRKRETPETHERNIHIEQSNAIIWTRLR
jgi:hypothetical protein